MTEIDWVLLGRYAADDCTPEERARVEQWLVHVPEYRVGLEAIQRVTAQARDATTIEERTRRLARWRRRIAVVPDMSGTSAEHVASPDNAPRRATVTDTRPRRLVRRARIAAIILLLIGGSLAGYRFLQRLGAPDPTVRTVTTVRGERASLRLPDGTLVVLGPASTLRLSATYDTGHRAVELDGEAEFTVMHDARRLFTVRTARLVAHDLGTRFLVRAYAEELAAEVVVAEGRVAVIRNSAMAALASDSVVLLRGERARATSRGRLTLTRHVPLDRYFVWTEGQLVFRGTPLREVVSQIERWRNISIDLVAPAALREAPFIGVFRGDVSTAEVIRVTARMYDLKVEQTDPRSYTLRAP